MTTLKKKIILFFTSRKANVFLLFVVLAALFSVLTKLSQEYTQTIGFDINAFNIPEDKVIIKDSAQKINVTLTTYGFKLISYYFSNPSVNVDIAKLDKNEDFFLWTQKKEFSNIISQFESNVKIENINPDTLRLRYDTNTVKRVPVILKSSIEFSPGYDLVSNYVLSPDSIKVIGPKVLIDSINSISTVSLNLKNVISNISSPIALSLPKHEQITFSNQMIQVNAPVERFTEGTIDVQVIVNNIPENVNLKIYPKSVEVVYYTNLEAFKTIASNSFIVECDYNEAIRENVSYLIPKITLKPDQVKSARLNLKRIEFIITK